MFENGPFSGDFRSFSGGEAGGYDCCSEVPGGVSLLLKACPQADGWDDVDVLMWMMWRLFRYMGVSLNGGTPKTPQNDHF